MHDDRTVRGEAACESMSLGASYGVFDFLAGKRWEALLGETCIGFQGIRLAAEEATVTPRDLIVSRVRSGRCLKVPLIFNS
jgi:hypothetical protein